MKFTVIILLLSTFYSSIAYTQSCCSGGVPVSSNIGLTSDAERTLQVNLSTDFNVLQDLYDGSNLLDDELRKRTTQSYILRAAYSITDRLHSELFFPFIRQTRSIIDNQGDVDFQSSFGVGDPIVMFYYKLLDRSTSLTIGAGPQLPLGSYNERSNRGLLLVEDLQPGSGAVDFVFYAALDQSLAARPSSTIFAKAIYSATGTNNNSRNNTQRYTFGDDLQIIAGVSDQFFLFNSIINPGISFRYRNAARDKIDDNLGFGTGGRWIFSKISLAKEFYWESSLAISLEVPISTFVNETQLSPSYIFNISWQKSFTLSKESNDELIKF